jgi:RNA polymerase sigma-70 factor (ECF subfamily)
MISVPEYKQAVKEYTRCIFRFLYKSLRDEEAVNDLVQDCYLKLWQNKDSIDPQKIKSWLFSVAYRAMLNYVQTASRNVKLAENRHATPVYQKNEFDTRAILEKALNELPPQQKSILLLRDLEGYEYREIGEILDLSESQVKVYLFRARQKVKNYIKELTNVL